MLLGFWGDFLNTFTGRISSRGVWLHDDIGIANLQSGIASLRQAQTFHTQ